MIQKNVTAIAAHTPIVKRAAMAAAASVAFLALGGCGNSPHQAANQAAYKASVQAAKLTASAGSFQAKQHFPGKLKTPLNLSRSSTTLAARAQHVQHSAATKPDDYLQPTSVHRDLKQAGSLVSHVLAMQALGNRNKAQLETQRGLIYLAEAQHKLDQLNNALLRARRQAFTAENLSFRIGSLGRARVRLAHREAAGIKTLQAKLAKARAKASHETRLAKQAAARLAKLSQAYKAQQKRASRLQRQGFTVQAHAQTIQGRKGIKLYQSALKILERAAHASEVADRQAPGVYLAKEQETSLALHATEYQAQAKALQASVQAAKATAIRDQKEALSLQQKARLELDRTVRGKHTVVSVTTAIDQLNTALSGIHLGVAVALRRANMARTAFMDAMAAQQNVINDSQKMVTNGYHQRDPLVAAMANTQPLAISNYDAAMAAYCAAQAHIVAYEADGLRKHVGAILHGIYRDVPNAQPVKFAASKPGAAQKHLQMAIASLQTGLTSLNSAGTSLPASAQNVKYLIPALQAAINAELSQIGPAGQRAAYQKAAATEIKLALRHHQSLQLGGLLPK